MSTFFEKLTGARAVAPAESTVQEEDTTEAAISRPAKKPAPSSMDPVTKPVRSSRREPDAETPVIEESPEEEGELTVDIYDAGDSIVIQSTVAGVRPEDLDVSISEDTITIRGRRTRSNNIPEEQYYYKELFWGSFSRTVILPEEIDKDATDASLKYGLLTITLPKQRKGAMQRVKIKSL